MKTSPSDSLRKVRLFQYREGKFCTGFTFLNPCKRTMKDIYLINELIRDICKISTFSHLDSILFRISDVIVLLIFFLLYINRYINALIEIVRYLNNSIQQN